jgi:hypothetical protein
MYIPFKGGAVLKENGRKKTAIDYHNEVNLSRFFLIRIAKMSPLRKEVGGTPKHRGRFAFPIKRSWPFGPPQCMKILFCIRAVGRLSRLSQFCRLKDIIGFNEQTIMTLKPPLVPGSEFRVSSFYLRR